MGIIDKKGEIVLEPKFDDIDTNDYPFKFKQDTRYGFLDEKAKILFDIKLKAKEWDIYFSYNDVKVFMDKYYLVIEHGRYRIFNMKDNRLASSLSFDFVQEYKKFIIASINDKIGIIDKDLNWLILPKFEEFKEFDKNHYKIILDGKIGLLDNNLHTILEPKYDYIGKEFINGFVKIGLNNKYGFISESGEIIEPQFDYVWNFSNDIAEVLVDKETKFINTKGEFIE
ncbi:WG repeat-containing protein [Campylobacter coli]|uniref:WG repeat-containing protein n=1 Tax=Campylobacter coli TaxID=195 RepID=UPI0009307650|nr:WG repeat-containing protein [Campylobacter coli]